MASTRMAATDRAEVRCVMRGYLSMETKHVAPRNRRIRNFLTSWMLEVERSTLNAQRSTFNLHRFIGEVRGTPHPASPLRCLRHVYAWVPEGRGDDDWRDAFLWRWPECPPPRGRGGKNRKPVFMRAQVGAPRPCPSHRAVPPVHPRRCPRAGRGTTQTRRPWLPSPLPAPGRETTVGTSGERDRG